MPPVIVAIPAFDVDGRAQLLQMRVADFVVKPVAPLDLVRACARAAQSAKSGGSTTEAQIYTFLPAAGGVGLTTLAIETAMLLLKGEHAGQAITCLVDLDFQHGSCCDYLDLEPRLDLDEIEPRPERLDRQLLEVMLSEHPSGLKVIAAPSRPAEMRSFDFEVVTRLLDLVAAHFDNVVIDVPRTWFAWTDSVLIGSNRLFLVTEMTVPGLKHARHLVNVIRERLPDGPQLEGDRQPLRAAPVRARPAPRRHRAGARRLARRHDPEQFPPGAARRSTAACRSTRSRPATTSRSALEKLVVPAESAKSAREAGVGSSSERKLALAR